MSWIEGSTVVLTGASSGIGRELVLKLVKDYKCTVIGIGQSRVKMESIKQELSYYSDDFKYSIFDVAEKESWEKFYDILQKNGVQVDFLINDAGMLPPFSKFVNYTEEQIQQVMDVNFYACMYSIQVLSPMILKAQMPGIINITSSGALVPLAGTSIYSASKAAQKALTESLIAEMGRRAYIAYVCPGFTRTDIFRNQYVKKKSKLINFMSSDPENIADKILKKINRKKSRIIVGRDAKIMNVFTKFFPVLSLKFYEVIMKESRDELFQDIF